MRISLVICSALIGQNKDNLKAADGFVQFKSPAGLSKYKCTEAGISSHITVPFKANFVKPSLDSVSN